MPHGGAAFSLVYARLYVNTTTSGGLAPPFLARPHGRFHLITQNGQRLLGRPDNTEGISPHGHIDLHQVFRRDARPLSCHGPLPAPVPTVASARPSLSFFRCQVVSHWLYQQSSNLAD